MNRIKSLTAIGSTDIIGLAISSSFWFFLATLIEPKEYGFIFYFLSIAGTASLIAPIATNYVSTVYSAKKVEILSELYTISTISTGIGVIVVYFLTQRIDICFFIFGTVFFNLTTGKMFGEKNFKLYAITNLFQKCTTMIFGFIFYFLFGLENIIYALALSYIFHIGLFIKDIKIKKLHFAIIKTRIRFIISNYLNNIVGLFGGQVDKLVIGSFFGFVLLGNYSVAIQVIGVMMIIPNVIFRYVLTEDLYDIKNREFKKKILVFTGIISILGIFVVPEAVSDFFPKYKDIVDAVRIMSFSIVPATYAKIQTARYLSQEKSGVILGGTLTYIVILFSGIALLVNFMGIIGLAISFTIACFGQALSHTIINKKL